MTLLESSTLGTTMLFLASGAIIYYLNNSNNNKKDLSLPPLAPGYVPVLGHLLQIAKPVPMHELFHSWSQQVGPVFTCHFGVQRWIVLNSIEAIKDLIVERGTIYSSRNLPESLTQDLMQGDEGGSFAFFAYGANWRRLRRIAHGGLVKTKINHYQPILDDRRTTFLASLYKSSQEKENVTKGISLSHFIEHYTMTSILAIAYGNMCNFQPGDPVLHKAFALTKRAATTMSPADQMREFFPILKTIWPVKREKYFKLRDDCNDFYGSLLSQFQAQEKQEDCFVKDIIQMGELNKLQLQQLVMLFVGAGSDTTAATLEWLVAFLANHPKVQDKAYEEIQNEVGLDRLPGAQDESRLHYIQGIILETLRLRPPAPIAIPHATSKADRYKSWVILEDTIVIMNLYAVHHDPVRFPEPYMFKPERHLPFIEQANTQKFSQQVEDRPHLSFSTGRRVCVGIHLAERNLFMAVSMLVACFKFETVGGAKIDVTTPKDVYAPTYQPCHYLVKLVPRHDRVATFF